MKLSLQQYRKKGIIAYLVPVQVSGLDIIRGEYINGTPVNDEQKWRDFQQKSAELEIDLDTVPDSLYEYKEARGHKPTVGYLRIADGEIEEEWTDRESFLQDIVPPEAGLPEIVGASAKQVKYAESCRRRLLAQGAEVDRDRWEARYWIDRSKED